MKNKEFWGLFITAGLTLGMMPIFTSCSSEEDDDNNVPSTLNFAEPAFAKQAKLLKITGANSPYATIEFTESGNYVIVLNSPTVPYAPARIGSHHALHVFSKSSITPQTRAHFDDEDGSIICGHYTMTGDNVYNLANFGTIEVKKEKNGVATIVVTPMGEEPFELTASVAKTMPDSEMTRAICRTWSFEKMRVVLDVNGQKLDKTYPWTKEGAAACTKDLKPFGEKVYEDLYYYLLEDFETGDQAYQIICSKAGSYMVLYANQSLAISTWGWDKYEPGLFRYSWDYDSLYNPEESGTIQVSFEDEYCLVKEDVWDRQVTEEEFSGVGYTVYYGKEVK